MKDSESIEDFYNRIIIITNQMRLNGEDIEDKRIIEKVLRSLTRKFEYTIVAIEESKDLSEMSPESLLGTLQSHELRLKQFDAYPIKHAFQSQVSFKTTRGKEGVVESHPIQTQNKKTKMKEPPKGEEGEDLCLKFNVIVAKVLVIP